MQHGKIRYIAVTTLSRFISIMYFWLVTLISCPLHCIFRNYVNERITERRDLRTSHLSDISSMHKPLHYEACVILGAETKYGVLF